MGGRGLEILKPRRNERDLLVVDRLDEVGLRARVSQAVLIPMMNSSCKTSIRAGHRATAGAVLTRDELKGTQGCVRAIVRARVWAVGSVAPPRIICQ